MIFASETDKIWKIGYVSGTFDMFHIGHLNLIRNAKGRCKHLIVGVLDDDVSYIGKQRFPVHPLKDRMAIIKALKYVDEVDITSLELCDKVKAWEKYQFDAMFSGDDHANDGWAREDKALKSLGADIVFFTYTQGVSTTELRMMLNLPLETPI